MSTAIKPAEILANLRDRRLLREPVVQLRDYWRTYGLLILHAVVLLVFNHVSPANPFIWLAVYTSFATILLTVIKDTRRAINRHFDLLIHHLEKPAETAVIEAKPPAFLSAKMIGDEPTKP